MALATFGFRVYNDLNGAFAEAAKIPDCTAAQLMRVLMPDWYGTSKRRERTTSGSAAKSSGACAGPTIQRCVASRMKTCSRTGAGSAPGW